MGLVKRAQWCPHRASAHPFPERRSPRPGRRMAAGDGASRTAPLGERAAPLSPLRCARMRIRRAQATRVIYWEPACNGKSLPGASAVGWC